MFQKKIKEFKLPEGFEVIIEVGYSFCIYSSHLPALTFSQPWPYGGLDAADEDRRFFQGLIFAADASNKNLDTNFYPYPLPIIPIMDWAKQEIVRIDELATGGTNDDFNAKTHQTGVLDHSRASEYVPELIGEANLRKDLKALNVTQPDGPSFTVDDQNLVEWQKWRFRVSFNPREGAVIHDVWYDNRSIAYRLSFSEMVCFSRSRNGRDALLNTYCRLYHMLIHAHHSIASKHSTLVMAVSATAQTTSSLAAIVLV